jgi:hypothetical protein
MATPAPVQLLQALSPIFKLIHRNILTAILRVFPAVLKLLITLSQLMVVLPPQQLAALQQLAIVAVVLLVLLQADPQIVIMEAVRAPTVKVVQLLQTEVVLAVQAIAEVPQMRA